MVVVNTARRFKNIGIVPSIHICFRQIWRNQRSYSTLLADIHFVKRASSQDFPLWSSYNRKWL